MRIAKGILVLLAVAVCLGYAGMAMAAVPTMTVSEMTDVSQTIVHGQVLSLVPHWDDERGMIYTTVAVEPIQYMKGEPGAGQIEFEMPGGIVGDIGLAVSDVPDFEVGEEVVLFLRTEYFQVVGWRQGKFDVKDGVVLGQDMTVEQFRAHIAELTGLPGAAMETRGADGAVVRPAEFVAPAPPVEGASNETGPGPKPAPNGEVVIMTENFEGAFPGVDWDQIDSGGSGHLWSTDGSQVHAGSASLWECAGGTSALSSGSDYANSMQTWARYGPFDLSDANSAELKFWRSVRTADVNDIIFWAGSDNGASFSGFTASLGGGAWVETTMDLASWLGDDSVWIAFMFQSDASGTDKGVFIDDVELKKTIPDVGSPEITNISPGTGPSGAGFSVTITGTDFGATQGGSDVEFVWDPLGTPTVAADVITSWSDTQIICEVPERASSGLVHVNVGGDPGTGMNFTVTYGKSSTWWQTSEPMGEPMRINPNTADDPAADVLDACINGFQEWNAEGGGDFFFTYGGATAATDDSYNGINEIAWGETGGSLATNYSWFIGSALQENDIIFDDVAWTWSASGAPGEYDIQSVMTHELGHCLRLMDLYGTGDPPTGDAGKTMYGRTALGQTTPRTIEAQDKAGLQSFYPAKTLNITSRDLSPATTPVFYSEQIVAVGGTPPRTFALNAGSTLPTGMSLSAGGVVSGWPQQSGTFYFNVKVTDNALETDGQVIKLFIDAAAPVALEQFSATPVDEGVLIEWNLTSESDLGEFYLHRSVADRNGYYEILNDEPVIARDQMGRSYSFLDKEVVDGTLYYYKLETREGQGGTFFGPVSTVASLGGQAALWLGQNRPNPFSPSQHGVTVISFSVPAPAHATIRVYDVAGRLVAVPLDAAVGAGVTDAVWNGLYRDGAAAPSGIYFYELYTDGIHSTRKMTLMR